MLADDSGQVQQNGALQQMIFSPPMQTLEPHDSVSCWIKERNSTDHHWCSKFSRNTTALCCQRSLMPQTEPQLKGVTKQFPMLSERCSSVSTHQSNSDPTACHMLSASSIPCHLQAKLPAQLKSQLTKKKIGLASRCSDAEFGQDHQDAVQPNSDQFQEKATFLAAPM